MMRKFIFTCCVAISGLLQANEVQAQKEPKLVTTVEGIKEYELPNGLRYAVRNNRVPPGQVSIRIRVDAGSLNERDEERGFAHLIEHLLFRQSQYLGDGEAIPTWQRLGASFGNDTNAETTPACATRRTQTSR